jgi:hypothetical protein
MNAPLFHQWRPTGPLFTPTVKAPGDHVISFLNCRKDRLCRCSACKPSLVRKFA